MRRLSVEELQNRVQLVNEFMAMELSACDLENGIVLIQRLIGDKGYRREAVTEDGYLYYCLRDKKAKRAVTVYIHHIILLLADPDEYVNQMSQAKTINHKNGIKTDNSLSNLEYLTQSENSNHAYITGLSEERVTEKAIDESTVYQILKAYHIADLAPGELADAYGLSLNSVKRIVQGRIHRPMYMMFRAMNKESIILRKKGSAKVTDTDVLEILDLYFNQNMSQAAIADKYNLARTTVTMIIGGHRWREVYEEFNKKEGKGAA